MKSSLMSGAFIAASGQANGRRSVTWTRFTATASDGLLGTLETARTNRTARTKKNHYLRAWYVFSQIKELERTMRNPFQSGSDAIEAILADLRSQLNTLRERFFGKSEKKQLWLASFEVPPVSGGITAVDLFTYDKVQGVCWVSPTYVKSAPPALATNCSKPITVSLKVEPEASPTTTSVIATAQSKAEGADPNGSWAS